MAEPPAPHEIARRAFDVVRRGYDQQAVRAYLHEVSSLVERLQRSERELRERAERAEARAAMVEHPDEATMLELLGEETTRVLTSAKEAASDIRSKAEASAERLIADATSEAAAKRTEVVAEAEASLVAAKAEAETILEQARTELARRSEEAEQAAARIREEGREAAEALRAEGARDLASAREEAEAAVEAAKAEGKSMVAEAQAVRERVLRDLQVRRKKARLQVEKLNAGRERLLEAYEVVRRTIDEATNELNVSLIDARIAADAAARRIEDEPEPTLEQLDAEVSTAGLADLPIAEHHEALENLDDESPSPLSGEVPVVGEAELHPSEHADAGSSAEPSDAAAGDDQADDHVDETAHEGDAPAPVTTITAERRSRRRRKKGFDGLPVGELSRIDPAGDEEGVRILTDAADSIAEETAGEAGELDPAADEAAAEADGEGEGEAAVDDAVEDTPEPEPEPDPTAATDEVVADDAAEDADRAGDVFARLRAEQPPEDAGPAEEAGSDASPADGPEVAAEPSPDAAAFAARDEAIAPIVKELGRRLKRSLADEQNEVLDLLRRAKPKGVDDLLPSADDHAARWAEVATAALGDAAAAGAGWAGGSASSVADLADELARQLVGPLRDRIDRSFAASDGNLDDVADRVRALYREWKGQKLSETSQHFVVAAYARGVLDASEPGAQVRWVVDPSTAPCPDCDDNVLAGAITKGDDFPTGSAGAPAHTGCRCLVLGA